jgi:hypothetical protein
MLTDIQICDKRRKAIPAAGYGGLWDCEMLRIPHCPDTRLTDGDEVVRITRRQRSTP